MEDRRGSRFRERCSSVVSDLLLRYPEPSFLRFEKFRPLIITGTQKPEGAPKHN
jgi:hypothetical protein